MYKSVVRWWTRLEYVVRILLPCLLHEVRIECIWSFRHTHIRISCSWVRHFIWIMIWQLPFGYRSCHISLFDYLWILATCTKFLKPHLKVIFDIWNLMNLSTWKTVPLYYCPCTFSLGLINCVRKLNILHI